MEKNHSPSRRSFRDHLITSPGFARLVPHRRPIASGSQPAAGLTNSSMPR